MSKDKLIATAPETIWLCVSDDPDHYRLPFPKDTEEVTWAGDHCPVCCGVKYVRSDVQSAELTALRKVAEAAEKIAASHEQWMTEGCFSNPTAPRAGQFWNEWVYEQISPALAEWRRSK